MAKGKKNGKTTDPNPRPSVHAQVPTTAMQPNGTQPEGGPSGLQPTAGAGQAEPAQTQTAPLRALFSEFEVQSFDLVVCDKDGSYPEPELLEFVCSQGGGDWEKGREVLDQWTASQLRLELDKLREKRQERRQRELMAGGRDLLPNPTRWAAGIQGDLNTFDGNMRSTTLPRPEVRTATGAPAQNPASAIERMLTRTLRAPPSKEITAEAMADPGRMQELLQFLCKDTAAHHRALKALGTAVLGTLRGTEPAIRAIGGLQGEVGNLSGEVANLSTDMGVFRDYVREQPIVEHPASGGGAPPEADNQPMDMEEGGAQPGGGGSDAQPGGSGSGAQPGGSGDQFAGLSLSDESNMPAVRLRPGCSWFWERGQWMTFQETTALANGNVKTYEDRLAEWARNDAAAAQPHAPTPPKVRMQAPQHFTGEGEVDPELWLMTTETFFTSMGVGKTDWGKQAQTLLRGKALTAYGAAAVPLYNSTGQSLTWDQVRGIVLAYKKADTPTVARLKLSRIEQGAQTVVDYTHTFKQLLAQVGADPPAHTDLLHYYMAGLNDPCPMSAKGKPWDSLEEAQEFHMQRELEGLKIRGPSRRTPLKPFPFRKSARPPLRLNSIKQGPGGRTGGRGGRDHGGRGQGGGRGKHAGQGYTGGFEKKRRVSDRAYGNNLTELLSTAGDPCPAHPDQHTKEQCHAFRRIKGDMETALKEKKQWVPRE
jgi:hypothetical protein